MKTTQCEASGQHQTLSFSLSRILRQFPLLSLWWGGLFFVLLPCSGALGEQHQGHGTEATVLDTLVVTTDRISEFTENNPHMVVVLGRKEMQERNMLSAEEALGTMAGVEVKRSSGVGSRISIRGSGKSGGVLVLLNGRPLNSSQYGGVDLASIPIDTIESITVFKPPVPVWLGPGGSDGAVSIVTRDTAPKGKDDKKQATRLRTTVGSYGSIEGNVTHNAKLDSGSAMASATGKHRDGKRTNSDSDSGNLLLHWENELADNQKLEIDGRYYGSEYGSPGPLDNATPDARQTYEKASLDSRLTGLAGASGDYAVNLYGDSIHLEDQSQSGFVSTLDDVKVGLKGAYNWSDAADQWAVRTSAILENDALEHTLSGNHDRITAGLGVQADRKWQALTVTSGVRGDQVTDFGLNPGLSGGMSYALAERWSLKANVGHSVNIPTFGQLYQPSHGSIDQSRGNPDLDKEKILSTDAGFEYRWDKSRFFQLTFFRADTQDPIVYQRGIDLIYRPVNGDRSWRQGLEANWKYGFNSGMTMDADVIVQDSEVEETGNELTYTPRVKATLALLYTLKGPGTRLETSARYNGKQYSEMENREEQRLDDYVTVDFKAIQPFKLKSTDVEWFLAVENLFDTGYQIHFGYPDDGIRLVSGFNFRF